MHFSFLLQEVLHAITANTGQVQRIVIFKKNGVQAMIEYPLQCILHSGNVRRTAVGCQHFWRPRVKTSRKLPCKSRLRKLTLRVTTLLALTSQ